MTQQTVTTRDRITEALEGRERAARDTGGPVHPVAWFVAANALTAWQSGQHPVEVADSIAARYAGDVGAEARAEARHIEHLITSNLAA